MRENSIVFFISVKGIHGLYSPTMEILVKYCLYLNSGGKITFYITSIKTFVYQCNLNKEIIEKNLKLRVGKVIIKIVK